MAEPQAMLVARSTNNGQNLGTTSVRIATPPQDIAEGAVQPTDHDVALATDGDV
ncbi:MAG: hypothetical protein R3E58_01485 [Phycisphaerae bacterium]